MLKNIMTSKLHRLTVTKCDLDYEGSISLDPRWMEAAHIYMNEQVHVWNITNGKRIITYAIPGEFEQCQLNGSAAHHFNLGDRIIVCCFSLIDTQYVYKNPFVMLFDDDNKVSLKSTNHLT